MPNAGDTIVRVGQSVNITWESNDVQQVNFSLYKQGVKIVDIFTKTSENKSNNSTVWTPGSSLIDESTPYTIRISSPSNPNIYDESSTFYILGQVQVPTPLPTITLIADRSSVNQGESVKIVINASNTTSVFVNGVGTFSPNDTFTVSPVESTTYTAIAYGPGGETTGKVYVSVSKPSVQAPKVTSFTINKSSVYEGEDIMISWSTTNAKRISITDGTNTYEETDLSKVLSGNKYLTMPAISSGQNKSVTYNIIAYSDDMSDVWYNPTTVVVMKANNQTLIVNIVNDTSIYDEASNSYTVDGSVSWKANNLNAGDYVIISNNYDSTTQILTTSDNPISLPLSSHKTNVANSIKNNNLTNITYKFNIKNSNGAIVGNSSDVKIYLKMQSQSRDLGVTFSPIGATNLPYGGTFQGFYITLINSSGYTLTGPNGLIKTGTRDINDTSTITFTEGYGANLNGNQKWPAGKYVLQANGAISNGVVTKTQTLDNSVSYGAAPITKIDRFANEYISWNDTTYETVTAAFSWSYLNSSAGNYTSPPDTIEVTYQGIGGDSSVTVQNNLQTVTLSDLLPEYPVTLNVYKNGNRDYTSVSVVAPGIPVPHIDPARPYVIAVPFEWVDDTQTQIKGTVEFGVLDTTLVHVRYMSKGISLTNIPGGYNGPMVVTCDNDSPIDLIAYRSNGTEMKLGTITPHVNPIIKEPVLQLQLFQKQVVGNVQYANLSLTVANIPTQGPEYVVNRNESEFTATTNSDNIPLIPIEEDSDLSVSVFYNNRYHFSNVVKVTYDETGPTFITPLREKDSGTNVSIGNTINLIATFEKTDSYILYKLDGRYRQVSSNKSNPTKLNYTEIMNSAGTYTYKLELVKGSNVQTQEITINVTSGVSNAYIDTWGYDNSPSAITEGTTYTAYWYSNYAEYVKLTIDGVADPSEYAASDRISGTMPSSTKTIIVTPYDIYNRSGQPQTISIPSKAAPPATFGPNVVNFYEQSYQLNVSPGAFLTLIGDVVGAYAQISRNGVNVLSSSPGNGTANKWRITANDTAGVSAVYELKVWDQNPNLYPNASSTTSTIYIAVSAPPTTGGSGSSGSSGSTGGYGGGGGGCPDPNMRILMNDKSYKKAGDLIVGDEIFTRHEHTGVYGIYTISKADIDIQPKYKFTFEDDSTLIVSHTHKFLMNGDVWKFANSIDSGDEIVKIDGIGKIKSKEDLGFGNIVKIEVNEAHTYIVEGFVSHNLKAPADNAGNLLI